MITNTASHQVPSLAVPNPQLMAATSQKHGIAVALPRNGQFLGRPTPGMDRILANGRENLQEFFGKE
jgi:hypothetical protein